MAKGRNGGSDTLSAESIGFGSGMKGGDGGGFALNQASADMGNRFAQDNGGGGLLGGFFSPGRMIGSGIGTLVAGPIGGILGGLIGGGIGRNRQQGGWGYTDAQGNRVSAFRDMFDGGGRGRFGDTFEGGLLSNVANNMGIRPAGYRARQAAMGQQPDYVGEMAAPVAGGGVVPTGGAASPMAAPADVAPPPTYLPINMNGVVAGSGQTPANGYVPPIPMASGPAPMAMAGAPDPMMLMGGQGYSPRPFVDVGNYDIGTVRPHVSRVPPPMPMPGVLPNVDMTPAPTGLGQVGPDAARAAQLAAFRAMQARASSRPLGFGGLLGR